MSANTNRRPCQIEQLGAYLDGELSEDACSELEKHIKACSDCNTELNRQRQLLCTLNSAFDRGSALQLPKNFAQTVAAYAESDMSGVRERRERKRALRLCALLAAASFALLGMASGAVVFNLARASVRRVLGIFDLVWTSVSDAVAGVAVVSRVLSKGLMPESTLFGLGELLLLALALVLLSRLIASYHRSRLTE